MRSDDLIRRIESNRERIRSGLKLFEKEHQSIELYDKILTAYTSNALEGNALTLNETLAVFVSRDDLARVRSRDELEALGHFDAHDYMMAAARENPPSFSEDTVKMLHYLFYRRLDEDKAGAYRRHPVFITGAEYVPPEAGNVPTLMAEFISELNARRATLHPVLLAAFAHRRLAEIHPFSDGNGRTARLLMNLILVNAGYRIISIPPVLRHEYISALRTAQRAKNPTDEPFTRLICECEIESQKDYCRKLNIPLKAGPGQER